MLPRMLDQSLFYRLASILRDMGYIASNKSSLFVTHCSLDMHNLQKQNYTFLPSKSKNNIIMNLSRQLIENPSVLSSDNLKDFRKLESEIRVTTVYATAAFDCQAVDI